MLALDMNLLATKLQNQTLEEGKTATKGNIQLINPETGYKLSESAQAKLAGVGQGKKVWTVSLNSDKGDGKTSSSDAVTPQNPGRMSTTKVLCSHRKLLQLCVTCSGEAIGEAPPTPAERPKKRHCRSMSVPQETETSIPPAKSTWQPQGSGLWKPVAVTNVTHSGRNMVMRWSPTDTKNYEFSSLARLHALHSDAGHVTPDDLLTPPESPIPRPSSVYSDGAISPFTSDYCYDYSNKFNYLHGEFRNRSLSVEDKISNAVVSSAGSVSSMPALIGSVQSSPHHRYRVPRCRSQPSFYDRKSGRRRRRDCRPTLNFHKMTETAYGHHPKLKSEPLATPTKDQHHFHDALENVMRLMPIASSPRDTEMPLQRLPHPTHRHSNSPIHELDPGIHGDGVTMATASIAEDESRRSAPVQLLGDEEDENDMEVFQITEELDLEQIENH